MLCSMLSAGVSLSTAGAKFENLSFSYCGVVALSARSRGSPQHCRLKASHIVLPFSLCTVQKQRWCLGIEGFSRLQAWQIVAVGEERGAEQGRG